MLFGTEDDASIEERLGVSRADHENRNQFNELPNGKLNPSPEDETIWKDDDGRPWKLNAEQLAAYHQETWFVFAYITAQIGRVFPSVRVPNLKFFSPNADGKFSEVIANRYTGELVIDQRYIGTYNFCSFENAPNAMKDGNKLHVQIFVLAWSKTFREKSFSTTSVLRARPSIVGECEL